MIGSAQIKQVPLSSSSSGPAASATSPAACVVSSSVSVGTIAWSAAGVGIRGGRAAAARPFGFDDGAEDEELNEVSKPLRRAIVAECGIRGESGGEKKSQGDVASILYYC